MPTYEYRCTKCAFAFEEYQPIIDEPLKVCPKCGGLPERVISGGSGLLFKGKGFYITDYRSAGYKKDAKNDASKSDSKSTDSKSGDSASKSGDSSSKSGDSSSKTGGTKSSDS